ncbi:TonB-dependent receptor [Rhizobium sp. CRIBSB]|nr:TonB-dependent receptor [Rhizobium sp. CRIBSB]
MTLQSSSLRSAVLAGTALATLTGTPLYAQQTTTTPSVDQNAAIQVDEVIVTARRVSERLQDVPVAVTAISGDDLTTQRIDNTEALRFVAPALQVSPSVFGKAIPGYTIRSQRQLESLITQDPAVGIYFAEQVQQRPHGTNSALYDLASVEVLKGPQGTLFGRNTTGGAVLINPVRPSQNQEGMFSAELGEYDLRRFTGVLNLPISDTFAIRMAGRITRRDGYVTNLTNGRKTDDERTESGRISALWTPNDRFSSYTVANYFHQDDAGAGFALANLRAGSPATGIPGISASFARQSARADFWSVENNWQPFARVTSWGISNTSVLELDTVTIKNIFGYREVKSHVAFDYDGSPTTTFESENRFNADQWTQELQLSGDLSEKLSYIGGVYYFREEGRDTQNSFLFGPRTNDGSATNESYSAYVQMGYELATDLNLTAGFRYTIDDRAFTARSTLGTNCRVIGDDGLPLPFNACAKDFDTSFESPSWLLSIDYKVTPDTLVYASHRRGYRSGGWNLRGNRLEDQVPFEPETVDDIELGMKSQMFDRRLTVNLAAYHQWYKDIQRTLSFGTPLRSLLINAGGATIKGGELEIKASPQPWLDISATAAYSDPEYTDFFRAEVGDLSGNIFAQAPELTYTLAARVYVPIPDEMGQLEVGASYYHQSEIYVSDLNQGAFFDLPIEGYGIVDLTVDWRNVGGYGVDLGAFVKNLGDEEHYTSGASLYPTIGTAAQTFGNPRQWGLSLTYRFGAMADR